MTQNRRDRGVRAHPCGNAGGARKAPRGCRIRRRGARTHPPRHRRRARPVLCEAADAPERAAAPYDLQLPASDAHAQQRSSRWPAPEHGKGAPTRKKDLVEFRPAGRNKMRIHSIRRFCRPEIYGSPRKCEICAPLAHKLCAQPRRIFSMQKALAFCMRKYMWHFLSFCNIMLPSQKRKEAMANAIKSASACRSPAGQRGET